MKNLNRGPGLAKLGKAVWPKAQGASLIYGFLCKEACIHRALTDAGLSASIDQERQTAILPQLYSKEREVKEAAGSKKRKQNTDKAAPSSSRAVSEEASHQDISASTDMDRETVALPQRDFKEREITAAAGSKKRKMNALKAAPASSRAASEMALLQVRSAPDKQRQSSAPPRQSSRQRKVKSLAASKKKTKTALWAAPHSSKATTEEALHEDIGRQAELATEFCRAAGLQCNLAVLLKSLTLLTLS